MRSLVLARLRRIHPEQRYYRMLTNTENSLYQLSSLDQHSPVPGSTLPPILSNDHGNRH